LISAGALRLQNPVGLLPLSGDGSSNDAGRGGFNDRIRLDACCIQRGVCLVPSLLDQIIRFVFNDRALLDQRAVGLFSPRSGCRVLVSGCIV
jgi:hypothetical protein